MPGSILGGKKAAETNKRKYGNDWYAKIGAKGGRNGHSGGFAANPQLAREAGRKGGLKSKRGAHMPDELWQLKQRLYYCKSRVSYYKNKLIEDDKLRSDYQIQVAEDGLKHWEKNLAEVEAKVAKLEA